MLSRAKKVLGASWCDTAVGEGLVGICIISNVIPLSEWSLHYRWWVSLGGAGYSLTVCITVHLEERKQDCLLMGGWGGDLQL